MYQVKPLNISGDNIYDVSNGQLINGGMRKMKYLMNKTHEYHTYTYIQIINNYYWYITSYVKSTKVHLKTKYYYVCVFVMFDKYNELYSTFFL